MKLDGNIALVTGASRGLGAATAIRLAALGAHVVLVARTQSGLEETDDAIRAAGGQATLLPMDLRDGDQVDRIAPSIYQRFGRLDIMVSNAGDIGTLTPTAHIDMKEWAGVHALNVDAPLRLIRGCAPLLVAAPAGRAVFVTAERATAPHAYWGHYAASLATTRALALTWAAETAQTRLKVNLFDPGPMATRLRLRAFPGEPADTHPAPEVIAPRLVELCLPG